MARDGSGISVLVARHDDDDDDDGSLSSSPSDDLSLSLSLTTEASTSFERNKGVYIFVKKCHSFIHSFLIAAQVMAIQHMLTQLKMAKRRVSL